MKLTNKNEQFSRLIEEIKSVVSNSKRKIKTEINNQLLSTYWQIGKIIVEKEKSENLSARKLILNLSKELSKELGRGY